jgi:N-acetylglucosaminyl-diphospho-decaprenol L-rhamnosyltransferase
VCIVNWNCRELLRGCLDSLLNEGQGVSLEVIVVDNASEDGAAAMVAREFPQVRLIQNRVNAGFARANNQAARIARGRFLFFLNNDTVVPEQALIRLVDYLDTHCEAVMVGPCLRDGRGKVQISYRLRPTIATFLHRTLLLRWTGWFRRHYQAYRRELLADARAVRPVDVLMGAALLVRRDEFMRLGAWDEDFAFGGEDLELCHRAQQRGQVVYLPKVEITHLGRASTRRNIGYASTRIAVGFAQYFRKSGATPAALLGYKLAITLDAPIQLVIRGGQYLLRRLRGRREQAAQSLTSVRGIAAFMCTGLWRFWRA